MQYLKIKNDGLLDMRLIYLMGGTTKANDKYKIGQFGTGLKYTLAYLIRNNILFHIFIGGKKIDITSKKEVIRDTEFDIIHINGERTSITSMVGLDWKAWMIVREIWCNALDETGSLAEVVENIVPAENSTEFYLQFTGEIKEVYENWGKYFIHWQEPIQNHSDFSLYTGGESLRFYKNGVLVKEIEHQKSVFAYDIKNISINELREFNGSLSYEIFKLLSKFDRKAVEIFINNIKGCYEEGMDYGWSYCETFNNEWKDAIGEAKFMDYETFEKLSDRNPELKETPIVQVPKGLYSHLVKFFPSISMLRVSDKVNSFYETFSVVLNERIKKCIDILSAVGYFIDPELKILTGIFGDSYTKGSINFDTKEIHISQDLEALAEIDICYVLVEEMEHYKTGFRDCTREFQTHFLQLYVNSILKEQKNQLALN
jgi:hypothetical protein